MVQPARFPRPPLDLFGVPYPAACESGNRCRKARLTDDLIGSLAAEAEQGGDFGQAHQARWHALIITLDNDLWQRIALGCRKKPRCVPGAGRTTPGLAKTLRRS